MELNAIKHFILIMSRIIPITLMSPAFGAQLTQGKVRLTIAAVLAFCITPVTIQAKVPNLHFGIITQLTIGTIMAFFSSIPFYIIQSAGEWIDLNRGESLSSLLVPSLQVRSTSLGRIYLLLSVALFFSTGCHGVLIQSLAESFITIPVNICDFNLLIETDSFPGSDQILKRMAELFKSSAMIGLPVVFVLWVVEIVLGLCNRIVPSLNVFFIALPLKLWIGILLVGILTVFRLDTMKEVLALCSILPP